MRGKQLTPGTPCSTATAVSWQGDAGWNNESSKAMAPAHMHSAGDQQRQLLALGDT